MPSPNSWWTHLSSRSHILLARGPAKVAEDKCRPDSGLTYSFTSKLPWGGGHIYFPWFTKTVTELDMVLPPLTYQGYLPNKWNNIMNSVTYLGAILFPGQKFWHWIFSLVSAHSASGRQLLFMGKECSLWKAGWLSLQGNSRPLWFSFSTYFTAYSCTTGLIDMGCSSTGACSVPSSQNICP